MILYSIRIFFQEIADCKRVMYQLRWTLETSPSYDYPPYFEVYGNLVVDIGQQSENQRITLWEVLRDNNFDVPIEEPLIISSSYIFQECDDFMTKGKITLYGEVMEYDHDIIEEDDIMGRYENKTHTIAELQDGTYYPGDDYVKINMNITICC